MAATNGYTPQQWSDLSLVNGFPATGDPVTNGPFGGAVAGGSNSPGVLTVLRCGLQGNTAASGGAIYWQGPLSVVESTVEDNHATGTFESIGQGGGVAVIGGGLTLQNATITANQAGPGNGGGLALLILSSEAFLTNSIVAGNSGGDCLFSGNAAVADHSLDSDGSCGLASDPGSLPGVNPLLGPLANNGGPTDTHALLAGSPAIDAGDNATCLPTDQRGVARPQGPACDIGAFEAQVLTPQDQIAALIAQIQALVTGGTLIGATRRRSA